MIQRLLPEPSDSEAKSMWSDDGALLVTLNAGVTFVFVVAQFVPVPCESWKLEAVPLLLVTCQPQITMILLLTPETSETRPVVEAACDARLLH